MSRQPDYRLKALNKVTGAKNNDVGAAWENEDGSISISLNPCILLRYSTNLQLTLFKNDKIPERRAKPKKNS